jgi:hypothetical protein
VKITSALLALCAWNVLSGARPAAAQTPSFQHVFIVVFENEEVGSVIGNPAAPYINQLAATYGTATNAYAITHPSLPNYMALTSGTTAFTTDCVGCVTTVPNIADSLEAAGRTWTAYLEDFPGGCGTSDSGAYAAKHNPFAHYTSITSAPARCAAHMAPFSQFTHDLTANTLADYIWITPNLCDDMHDCSVGTGDAWLAGIAPQILQSPAFANSVLLILFDEGTSNVNGGGQVPLIVASPLTPPGFKSAATVTHYNVLRTIEDAWSLPALGQSASASAMSDFFPRAAATQPSEQVLYSSDMTIAGGAWMKVADPTAAGGLEVANPDRGADALSAPLAAPPSYVEASFNAVAGVRYRVWLRMRAQLDSKWNDSVFEQFTGAVDAQGHAVYRTGTSNGIIVNLWPCATCQSIGWGWQRNAYWLADTGDVWFAATGTHRIRIQTREDGSAIDQIVISPSRYVTAAPGAVTNDTTIVPKPGVPPAPSGTSTPFGGTARTIPGTIAGSDFDEGGEGVAYHDTTAGNAGGVYRATDVDLQASADGGFNVGWIAPGEWLKFTVNVTAAGAYTVTFRVAAPGSGGTFHLEMNGVNVTGAISVPATGGWQTWQNVSQAVVLPAGPQVARLVFDNAGAWGGIANFNTMQFTSTHAAASTPFTGSPLAVPGTIEVEQFDNGGEGVAYHDTTAGNAGGAFRSTDVDIEPSAAGGYDVGWVSAGEWLNYTVNVASTARYAVTFRVACVGPGGTFHLEANGINVTGTIAIPDTGGWQAWQTVTSTASLNAGVQVLRLVMDTTGSNAVGNFDSFTFK